VEGETECSRLMSSAAESTTARVTMKEQHMPSIDTDAI
jgi:hypothetical protein